MEKLSGVKVEMNFCAITFNKNIADKILIDSHSNGWEITGEWILLLMKNSIPLVTKEVDWLSWEDPFWEHINEIELKKERENDKNETLKRLKTNLPILQLLTEDRFKKIYKA